MAGGAGDDADAGGDVAGVSREISAGARAGSRRCGRRAGAGGGGRACGFTGRLSVFSGGAGSTGGGRGVSTGAGGCAAAGGGSDAVAAADGSGSTTGTSGGAATGCGKEAGGAGCSMNATAISRGGDGGVGATGRNSSKTSTIAWSANARARHAPPFRSGLATNRADASREVEQRPDCCPSSRCRYIASSGSGAEEAELIDDGGPQRGTRSWAVIVDRQVRGQRSRLPRQDQQA